MSDQSHLARYLGDFPRGRIACVGDVMLDRFVAGSVERISPEAPIPVLKVARETAMPGGAGNVAVNVASLGGQARLLGVVGDDGAARELGALLDDTNGVESTLVTDAARPTTVKTRYVAAGQQLLRADYEDTAPVAAATEAELRAAVGRVIGEANAVVVSDYGKGALTDAVLAEVMEKAGAAGVPVIVDPSGRDYGRYRGAAVVSPNRAELEGATGLSCEEDADVEQAARTIIDSCGVASLLVTRGASGLSLITADGAHHVPVQAREVFDVSGAGDTVLAAFALAGAAGASPLDAAHLANAAAGIVVAKVGTAVVRTDDLAEALADDANRSDIIAGIDLSDHPPLVSEILIDLAKRETMNLSATYASTLIREFDGQVRLLTKPHRSAGFVVLKSVDVPSVLVELGFLSNPEEERLLLSPKFRRRIVESIAAAVDRYFEAQRASR